MFKCTHLLQIHCGNEQFSTRPELRVVKSTAVSKTDKVKLFSEVVLRQLAELHQWQGPQAWSPGGESKQNQEANLPLGLSETAGEDVSQVADVADSFLLELCCSSKHGISFHDKAVGTGS
ncbi:nucleolar pre-ribosomal-associated protein 1, partial [Plakobranchus ocellatus]